MPIYGASLLTEDLLNIWLYLWRGSDICVIVEAQQRAVNAVKVKSYEFIMNLLDAAARNFDADK